MSAENLINIPTACFIVTILFVHSLFDYTYKRSIYDSNLLHIAIAIIDILLYRYMTREERKEKGRKRNISIENKIIFI
jgi:hypothetical protein